MHAERWWCHWCTVAAMTAWSSLAQSVLMWCLSSSRSIMHVLYTFSCSAPEPTGFKSGKFGGHSTQRWNEFWRFYFFLRRRHFSMTSQLRHHYKVWCWYWCDFLQFSVTQNVSMICAKCYEKLSKSVKIMDKILSVSFFILTRCTLIFLESYNNYCWYYKC